MPLAVWSQVCWLASSLRPDFLRSFLKIRQVFQAQVRARQSTRTHTHLKAISASTAEEAAFRLSCLRLRRAHKGRLAALTAAAAAPVVAAIIQRAERPTRTQTHRRALESSRLSSTIEKASGTTLFSLALSLASFRVAHRFNGERIIQFLAFGRAPKSAGLRSSSPGVR